MRVLCFGDSITQGFWSIEGGWAERLRKYYDSRQLEDLANLDEPTIFNLGISGDVTKGVIGRFKNELEARRWRWPNEEFTFVFAIGINDSITENGQERTSLESYYSQTKDLIALAKKESKRILFVGLTPVDESTANNRPGKPKEYNNERIKNFDTQLKKACSEEAVSYVGIYDSILEKMQSQQLFDDGLHPNDAGHQLMFEIIRPALEEELNR
jgi:lysophospholipase L1-like esterase